MSYDIRLKDPVTGETIELPVAHVMVGGTYAAQFDSETRTFSAKPTTEAWLNVTYNYAKWYYRDGVFPNKNGENSGIRTIYGISGVDSIPVLKDAISTLEDLSEDLSEDEREHYEKSRATGYWMPTRENAIKPLYQLLAMAQLRPDGVWDGD